MNWSELLWRNEGCANRNRLLARPRSLARTPLRSGLAAVLLAMVAVGCQTHREMVGGGAPPPEPRQPMATPPEAPVNAVALVFGPKPVDLDGDGIADLIELDAYLYSRPYPMSLFSPGTLSFELYAPGAAAEGKAPLGSWEFPPPVLAARADVTVFGPCYRIRLDLREVGLAPFPLRSGDLKCRFMPASGGAAVQNRGVERINFRS